ncbi:hypothetical protein AHAS_Ahas01G0272000 [Arachis hypogaea]
MEMGYDSPNLPIGMVTQLHLKRCEEALLEFIEKILTIMVDNIEKILERGDRIELLIDKTATTQDSAFHFRKQSKFRRALWMKNLKLL